MTGKDVFEQDFDFDFLLENERAVADLDQFDEIEYSAERG